MDELTAIEHAISYVTGMSTATVMAIYSIGAYIRNKYKKYRDEKKDKWTRDMELEVKRQLDFIYSVAYKAMESRIYYMLETNKPIVDVRHELDIDKVPLNAYKTGYKEAVKETAFKVVLPCIIGKIKDDKKRYDVDDNLKYITDTGEDIQHTFTSVLGRKVGICDISTAVEEDELTKKLFVDMYSKIIRRARGK